MLAVVMHAMIIRVKFIGIPASIKVSKIKLQFSRSQAFSGSTLIAICPTLSAFFLIV